ncbi:MAG: hypothetical protein HYW95_03015 [Candidatus Wildermuthbacteria bacterium]|nr:hypothetical protein [Candidatus Wildermuthbacteria bacterium]
MVWLFVTIFSYFLFAFSSLTDRYLLAGPLPHPRVYAFYTGITGILAVALIPLGFQFLGLPFALRGLAAGAIGLLGIYALYRAVFRGGVSRIVPMVGALVPIFTSLMAISILSEPVELSQNILIALVLFIVGTFFLSLRGSLLEFRPSWFDMGNALVIAFLFSFSLVLTKNVYDEGGFLNGFMWMRWGGFLASLSFLVFPVTRGVVFRKQQNPVQQKRILLPFLSGKGAGMFAFLLQQVALYLARPFQVALMSALQGVQYAFLLVFVAILSFKNPDILKEEFSSANAIWRIIGVACIGAGFLFFAV